MSCVVLNREEERREGGKEGDREGLDINYNYPPSTNTYFQ